MNKLVLNVPLRHKTDGFVPTECVVERIITIPQRAFEQIQERPMQDSPCIANNKQYMWNEGDTAHCVLFLSHDTEDGILVQCEGYDYARRSQYIPDAKNFVFASGFSAPENRIHEALVKMAEEAAKQCHNGEKSLNFKELADKMDFDFEEELGRSLAALLRDREDIAMAEYVPLGIGYQPDIVMKPKPLQTMRLISPLKIVTVPEDYGDYEEVIEPEQAVSCRDAINRFMQKYTDENERDRGLMVYYDESSPISEKIWSAVPSVEVIGDELMGVLTCKVAKPLNELEMAEFQRWWRGQRSDGYGEGLEQHEIKTAEYGDIYVSLWDGTDDCKVEIENAMNAADSEEQVPGIGGFSF